jgi:hypothetical protein
LAHLQFSHQQSVVREQELEQLERLEEHERAAKRRRVNYFTPEEDAILMNAQGDPSLRNNWSEIANLLPGRHPNNICAHWKGVLNADAEQKASKKRKANRFTPEEDTILRNAQADPTTRGKWNKIAKLLPGRWPGTVQGHWKNVLNVDVEQQALKERKTSGTPSHFSSEEDAILKDAVAELGNKWTAIAERLPGHDAKSLQKRWALIKKKKQPGSGKFTAEEDANLKNAVVAQGKSKRMDWSAVVESGLIPGRTATQLAKRWCYLQKKPKQTECSETKGDGDD